MRIAVVGLGKMGLPLAAWYASRGHHVTGCDINPDVTAAVNRGESPIVHEPGLAEMVRDAVAAGRLCAVADTATGVGDAETVIVLVPLGIDADHQPDYRALDAAFDAIGAGLAPGALVILETTVAVGDTRGRFLPLLERGGRRLGRDFSLAFSPERLQSGTVFRDLLAYPRVVGGVDAESGRRAAAFYHDNFGVEVRLLRDAEAAEFCKLAESVYRDVNIALANELARYAERHGVDVREVFPAANSQPQSHLHQPGIGVGGHCIPVYPYLLIGRTPHDTLATAARRVNDAMPAHAADMLADALGGLAGRRVLILGVAYRPGVKEAAHSPALALAAELETRGASVFAHDPLYTPDELAALGLAPLAIEPPPTVDAVVLQTAHAPYRALDFARFPGLRVVLDGRAALDPVSVATAGITYLAVGRGDSRTAAEHAITAPPSPASRPPAPAAPRGEP
jgi:nucleotide sugar dehydrogenase